MAAYNTPQYPSWQAAYEIDHVGAARTHLRAIFPEASLAPSSVEMTVIEALASMIGPLALSYRNAPSAVVEHLMDLHGVRRYEGLPALGRARFRVSTGAARVEIGMGTRLRYVPEGGGGALDFVTTEHLLILTSESVEGEVAIEAVEDGAAYNGVPAGSRLDALDYILAVESITVAEATHSGRNLESNDSFTTRAQAVLASQTSALVYAEQFENAAVATAGVGRAFVLNNYNGATGTTATGHVSVAVTSVDGMPLPNTDKDELRAALQSEALASLVVHVLDPRYSPVNIAVTVEAVAGANLADVQTAVEDALARRLDPVAWDWWDTITALDIASWVDDVAGVARVISAPATITLPGPAPLPEAGLLTVTVNESTR